jgi:hypothetical protein
MKRILTAFSLWGQKGVSFKTPGSTYVLVILLPVILLFSCRKEFSADMDARTDSTGTVDLPLVIDHSDDQYDEEVIYTYTFDNTGKPVMIRTTTGQGAPSSNSVISYR